MYEWHMGPFATSILASVLVAVVYGLLIAQKEEKIRTYLKNKSGGLFRWFYVRALIQAVRGDAGVADSRHLALLIVLLLAVTGSTVWLKTASLEENWSDTEQRLHQVTLDAAQPPDSKELDRRHQQNLAELQNRSQSVQRQLPWVLLNGRILSLTLFSAALLGWLVWIPYVLLRRRFAHEVARFSLRIQGLASQEELAKLTASELAVSDSDTLKTYVEIMKQIATRHGLPELTRTLELWHQ